MGGATCGTTSVIKLIRDFNSPNKSYKRQSLLPFHWTDANYFFRRIKSIGKEEFALKELAYALSE